MKTELEIAVKRVKELKKQDYPPEASVLFVICQAHKATCQRFLEFLTDTMIINIDMCPKDNEEYIKIKITDLKDAIKLYEDAGI